MYGKPVWRRSGLKCCARRYHLIQADDGRCKSAHSEMKLPPGPWLSRLSRRYKTAKVLSFGSPVGDWWVRVRVLQDDRKRAEEVARDTQTVEGKVFLVRLD